MDTENSGKRKAGRPRKTQEKRVYFVWRPDARTGFKTFRVKKTRPIPDSTNTIWNGDSYASGLRVQKAANHMLTKRKHDHPDQGILLKDFIVSFADTENVIDNTKCG